MSTKSILIAVLILGGFAGCKDEIIDPPQATTGSLKVSFQWVDAKGEAARVKVTLDPGNGQKTSSNIEGTVSFVDVAPGKYQITAQASNLGGEVTHQGTATGVIVEPGSETPAVVLLEWSAPEPPTGLTASKSNPDYVSLVWKSSPRATLYRLYRAGGGTFSLLASPAGNTWKDEQSEPARWYEYRVSAASAKGTSSQSSSALGYRRGWRWENVAAYNTTNGIGLKYNLYAFGFKNSAKAAIIYAVYKDGETYYHVPGGGPFGRAAYQYLCTPTTDEAVWNGHCAYIFDNTWDADWQNNRYPQFIKIRLYKNATVANLNDPYYAQTNYFSVVWVNQAGQRLQSLKELSVEESAAIDRELSDVTVSSSTDGSRNAVAGGELQKADEACGWNSVGR